MKKIPIVIREFKEGKDLPSSILRIRIPYEVVDKDMTITRLHKSDYRWRKIPECQVRILLGYEKDEDFAELGYFLGALNRDHYETCRDIMCDLLYAFSFHKTTKIKVKVEVKSSHYKYLTNIGK